MLSFESEQMLSTINKMFNTTFSYNEYADYAYYIGPVNESNKSHFEIHVPSIEYYDEELEQYNYNSIMLVLFDSNHNPINEVEISLPTFSSTYSA